MRGIAEVYDTDNPFRILYFFGRNRRLTRAARYLLPPYLSLILVDLAGSRIRVYDPL